MTPDQATSAAAGLLLIPIIFLGLLIIAETFWLWMLIDCIKNEKAGSSEKLAWVLIVIFLNWIGAFIYFFARKSVRKKEEMTLNGKGSIRYY